MLEIVLVRHGETESNVGRTFCGWTDVALNDTGRIQAQEVSVKLKGEEFDAFYSSPLKRAIETANEINKFQKMEICEIDSLKERNFGKWENKTYEQISASFSDEVVEWESDWLEYVIEGGESARQAFERVHACAGELVQRHKTGKVLVVAHFGTIRNIITDILGFAPADIWRFMIDNCGIVRLVVKKDGFAWLKSLNA